MNREVNVVNIQMVRERSMYSDVPIETRDDVIKLLADELKNCDREMFCILNLQNDGKVINMNVVSMGTLNSTVVSPREVFKSSILSNAAGIIAVHNHPSGSIKPSKDDLITTKRLVECGRLLDIQLLDHIIVSGHDGKSLSMRNEQMFEPSEIDRELKLLDRRRER